MTAVEVRVDLHMTLATLIFWSWCIYTGLVHDLSSKLFNLKGIANHGSFDPPKSQMIKLIELFQTSTKVFIDCRLTIGGWEIDLTRLQDWQVAILGCGHQVYSSTNSNQPGNLTTQEHSLTVHSGDPAYNDDSVYFREFCRRLG